jgi:hypothetical protein
LAKVERARGHGSGGSGRYGKKWNFTRQKLGKLGIPAKNWDFTSKELGKWNFIQQTWGTWGILAVKLEI